MPWKKALRKSDTMTVAMSSSVALFFAKFLDTMTDDSHLVAKLCLS